MKYHFDNEYILSNISTIDLINKNYEKALEQCIQSRNILQENNSFSLNEIIQCHHIIGDIYLGMKNYLNDEQFYLTTYEMSKQVLFIEEKALEYSLKQLLWYENHFSERYLSIANILLEISQLYDEENSNKIVYLEKALNIFQNNIHIQYLTTSNP